MRIVIPVLDESGINARLSEHFGRAPYFFTFDLNETGQVSGRQTIANTSEHFGGVGRPPDRILKLNPHVLITYGMGLACVQVLCQLLGICFAIARLMPTYST